MDVNAVNEMGLTAVHAAANEGSDEIIEFLVEKGAKLDVKDKEGRTRWTRAEGIFLAAHPAKPKTERRCAHQEADRRRRRRAAMIRDPLDIWILDFHFPIVVIQKWKP